MAPTGNESLANCMTLELSKNESSAQLSLAACTEAKPYMCQVFINTETGGLDLKLFIVSPNVKMQLVRRIAPKTY
jgi:hypothetical protein